jgi:ATP-dependent DNA helicase RecG
MFDDHFIVESPGILPGLVRISNIREFHFSRNPKIVELLTEYEFVKELGEGVDRIYREMAEAGLPEPEYRQADFMLSAILKNKNWGKDDLASWVVNPHDTPHDTPHDQTGLLEFCATPRTRQEMMEFMGLVDRKHFTERYLKPLLASGKLEMTIPDKAQSKNQKYKAKK